MTIQLPPNFNLPSTINSHGWYDLPPFAANETKTELHAVISLSKTKHVAARIRAHNSVLTITVENGVRLTTTEKERLKNIVRSMLRIDEALEEFYSLCRKSPHLRWVPKRRAGRMLRSPSVFEDVVKMMFTTNCSWALTKIQTTQLTQKLGIETAENIYSFPFPETIAKKSDLWLRKEISCGYRSGALILRGA